jgi:hypothetical protein
MYKKPPRVVLCRVKRRRLFGKRRRGYLGRGEEERRRFLGRGDEERRRLSEKRRGKEEEVVWEEERGRGGGLERASACTWHGMRN